MVSDYLFIYLEDGGSAKREAGSAAAAGVIS
jgi:hypothetical protein